MSDALKDSSSPPPQIVITSLNFEKKFGRKKIKISSRLTLGVYFLVRGRVAAMARLSHEVGVGFANLYTRLGKGAASKEISTVGLVMGNQRTFCNLPKKQQNATGVGVWKEAINDKAEDETTAHMSEYSFTPIKSILPYLSFSAEKDLRTGVCV